MSKFLVLCHVKVLPCALKTAICRKAGPLIRRTNGSPPTRGSLNMEVNNMMVVVVIVMEVHNMVVVEVNNMMMVLITVMIGRVMIW